jgi:hypothetical protein
MEDIPDPSKLSSYCCKERSYLASWFLLVGREVFGEQLTSTRFRTYLFLIWRRELIVY